MDIVDHVGMWAGELRDWLPARLFDAHLHLGPPDVVGPVAPDRLAHALCTYMHLDAEAVAEAYAALFSGKTIDGMIAFGFPQREVAIDGANDYVIGAMRRDPRCHGFLLSAPSDTRQAIAAYRRSGAAGVPFRGVKPYFDRVGKSVFDTAMSEFVPDDLLAFMNTEGLALMLHTSRYGMGDPENQQFLRRLTDRYPRVRVVLAHMGRYTDPRQFEAFMASGLAQERDAIILEMSSVSCPEVYDQVLAVPDLHRRLVFGSDLPFGLITGVERWSPTHGAVFVSRDHYTWSDPAMEARYAEERLRLTYNTYHCIRALKEAFDRLGLPADAAARLKDAIFRRNALVGILRQPAATEPVETAPAASTAPTTEERTHDPR